MLTGDKKETAINLGYSAGLLTQDRTLIGKRSKDCRKGLKTKSDTAVYF